MTSNERLNVTQAYPAGSGDDIDGSNLKSAVQVGEAVQWDCDR